MTAEIAFPLYNLSFLDYPNPVDACFTITLTGCEHTCEGCQNPKLRKHGQVRALVMDPFELIEKIEKDFEGVLPSRKIALIGGDPLHPDNVAFTKALCTVDNWDVCVYTGYDVDYVKNLGLTGFKFLKCGLFKQELFQDPVKTSERMVFASSNQILYDENYKKISKRGIYHFPEETF